MSDGLPISDSVTRRRVVKIGGSLLDLVDLVTRLEAWTAKQPTAINVWVVGGGRLADEVRERECSGVIDSEDAHWQAIEAMEASATQLFSASSNWSLVRSFENLLEAISEGREASNRYEPNRVFLPLEWLRSTDVLPHSWDVTSDSIAATLAADLKFDEVVLLKSVDAFPEDATTLAAKGIVDRYFPIAIAELDFRIVNLRGENIQG